MRTAGEIPESGESVVRIVPKHDDAFVSVVLVSENGAAAVVASLREVHGVLSRAFADYEIVVVDRRSGDGTDRAVAEILPLVPCVRYLELAARVSRDVAVAAGVENAIGDFVVVMEPGADPAWLVEKAVRRCRETGSIILGVADRRQSLAYAVARPLCRWLLDAVDYRLPRNATGFCCLSRRVVNSAGATGRLHHQFLSRVMRSGYGHEVIRYELCGPKKAPKRLLPGIRETMRLLVFNSTAPLRWINGLGLAGSALTFLIALYGVAIKLFKGDVVEGWTTTVLFMSFPFTLLFIILAFLGEYLLRLLDTIGEPSEYSVAVERTSTVMIDEGRINVTAGIGDERRHAG